MAYRARKKKLYKKRRTYRKKYGKTRYRKKYGRKSYRKSAYKRKYSKKACKCKNPTIYPKVLVKMPVSNREKVPDDVKKLAFQISNSARAYYVENAEAGKNKAELDEMALRAASEAAVAEGVREQIKAFKKERRMDTQ